MREGRDWLIERLVVKGSGGINFDCLCSSAGRAYD